MGKDKHLWVADLDPQMGPSGKSHQREPVINIQNKLLQTLRQGV